MKSQVNTSNKSAKNINDENNAPQQRRWRSREVSSRYMFPTASSAAAAAASSPFNNISDGFSPLRRSNSPTSNSLRRHKNGTPTTADCTRSVSAERRRPVRAAEDVKGDSAKALTNSDGARHPMRGLWPGSAATSNTMPTLADQLGNERLKKMAGRDTDRATAATLRRSDSSNRGARPKRTSADPPRRSTEENTKPVNGEYRHHNQNIRPNQKKNEWSSASGRQQMQGSLLMRSMESLNVLRAGKTLNRAASSLDLRPPSRSSKNSDDAEAGYSDQLQSILPARLSVDGGRSDSEGKSGAGPRNWHRDVDSASFEDRSLNQHSDDGGGLSTPRAGASKKSTTRGSYVPARFLQDTLSRLRRLSDGNSKQPLQKNGNTVDRRITASLSNSGHGSNSPWPSSPGQVALPSPVMSSPVVSSPVTTGGHGQGRSPNTPRGLQPSPVKTRGGAPSANAVGRMSNMLTFGMEFLKGKKSIVVQEETTHQLRMLHNRWLQWRFVNARAEAAHEAQILSAQDSLYNVWAKTSELRTSVVAKRIRLQKARHEVKLNALLAAHAVQLEDWATLEKEHAWAVRGAMECLDAAIVRIPLVRGAKADVRSVKQVLGFAVDVMNGIEGAATKFLSQAEKVDSLLSELAETVAEEKALLQECTELLAGVASLEMEEHSLRIHLIQLQQAKDKSGIIIEAIN